MYIILKRGQEMQINEFNEFLFKFKEANIDEKIDLYCTTINLTQDQYMSLLRTFPPSELRKLEKVLH